MKITLLALLLITSSAVASERDYQRELCGGLRQEVTLPNGARADCLSPTHAIEVEFSEKWAEALGQALSYAASTDLTARHLPDLPTVTKELPCPQP